MATVEEIREYYDNFLPYLKRDQGGNNPRHKKVFEDLRKIIKPDMRMIHDIGCGTGITSKFMAEQCGAYVVAVDLSPVLIDYARENNAHEGVLYVVRDVTEAVPDNIFITYPDDSITIIDCLEHIPRDKVNNVFKYISVITDINSAVYINIPDARFIKYMHAHHPDKLQIVDEPWLPNELIDKMVYYGFELESLDIYGIDVPYQYNSYVFKTSESVNKCYESLYGEK